ncbi:MULTISPECIES: hypothetical protein [unclassified Streptomyces]|uniref:hypothetical protein n=1 Tax=unclassified Streptomyces TaxID=2593676 RepID=UPI002E143B76|nr:hypothetical protein OG452_00825 [Streptomyces sp. NBC_01197]WSS53262.1 hypothetical protein OG708_34235 [Streptomyces sp. NBC_01180]
MTAPETDVSPERSPDARRQRLVHAAFWFAGLYFGWRWASESGPAWQHALQLLATLLAAMSMVQLVRRWRERHRRGGGVLNGLPVRDLFLAKLVLIASALAVDYLLQCWIPSQGAQIIAGAGLCVAFAIIGPALHRRHNDPPALRTREVRRRRP